ncbi:PIN domain-containing protein [Deferrisoma sp.]
MKAVLFDLNVVLDVLLAREPHVGASAKALDLASGKDVQGFIAAHCVTTLFYLLRRRVGTDRAHRVTAHLLERLRVAPVDEQVVRSALASAWPDLEDAVCHAAARAVGAECIVTRNVEDFRSSTPPALRPEVFVRLYSGGKGGGH